jgi:epoxyqueuosine reductase QueG
LDIEYVIKKAVKEENVDFLGFTTLNGKNAIVLGFAKNGQMDLVVLDKKTNNIAKRIIRAGFIARFLSAHDCMGSLRTMARHAGLGFIGKSGLLITYKFGPDVRLSAIITNAPVLIENKEKPNFGCGKCRECQIQCPSGALANQDPEMCRSYLEKVGRAQCTVCIDVCPFKR